MAVISFAIAMASLMVFAGIPTTAGAVAQNAATYAFVGGFLVLAPVGHLAGFAFGLAGMVRRNDNRLLSLLGILLNLLAVAVGTLIVYAGLQGMAAFT
jgi:hypothetical protein